MLSYSAVNVKLLQNIVVKRFCQRNCLLFSFWLLEQNGRSSMTSALRKLSAAGSACLCVFSEGKGRAGQRVWFGLVFFSLTMQDHFVRVKLLFTSTATKTVRLVCFSWLRKPVTMLTPCCSSVSPRIRKLRVLLCSREVLLWASQLNEGKGVCPVGRDCRNRFLFFSIIFWRFSTGKTSTF